MPVADQPIDTTDQQAVTVAQEDFNWLADAFEQDGATATAAGIRSGETCIINSRTVVEAIARRRLASVSSASAETWDSVAQWCEATFGPCGAHRMAERAMEEGTELLDETSGREEWTDKARIEVADMLICLSRVPGIWSAVEEKMAINRARTWDLCGDGTGYHVKPSASPKPVPATNQAGEVEFPREQIARLCLLRLYGFEYEGESLCDEAERIFSEPNPRAVRAVALADEIAAALATQPATSQEGEREARLAHAKAWLCKRWSQEHPNAQHIIQLADYAEALAATPTPLTLSEDLRDDSIAAFGAVMFNHIWDSFTDDGWGLEVNDLVTVDAVKAGLVSVAPYDPEVHNDQSGAAEVGDDFYEVTPAGRAALARAQGQAS